MVMYECNLCGCSSKIKTHHKRHLKTEKHGRNKEKSALKSTKEHKKNEKSTKEHKKYKKCAFCDTQFSTFANKRRHELHYCHQNPDNSKIILNKLKKQHIKEKEDLKKQIELLLQKVGNTTNINSTINNTIVLNNYGEEDLSHITDTLKTQLLKIPYGMIPKMIEHVHFNKKKPENKNIILTNSRDNKLKIYKNNKWIFCDKSETLNDLVDNKYFILENHFYTETDVIEKKLNDFQLSNYRKFRKLIDTGDKALIENIKRDCELLLLNNR